MVEFLFGLGFFIGGFALANTIVDLGVMRLKYKVIRRRRSFR